jgi:hypothetical protein
MLSKDPQTAMSNNLSANTSPVYSKSFVSPPRILQKSSARAMVSRESIISNRSNLISNKYEDDLKTPVRETPKKYRTVKTTTNSKLIKENRTLELLNSNGKEEKENTPRIIRDVNFYSKAKRDGVLDDTLNLSTNSDKYKMKTPASCKEKEVVLAVSTPFPHRNLVSSEKKKDAGGEFLF